MRPRLLTIMPAAVLASLAIVACGSDPGLVPAENAGAMDAALQRVADATNSGDCAAATSAIAAAQQAYDGLPSSVDARLRRLLLQGLEQLTQTVPEQCAQDALGDAGPSGTTGPDDVATTKPPATTEPPVTTAPPTETIPPTQTTPEPDTGGVTPDPGGAQGPDGNGPPGQGDGVPPGQGGAG